MHTTRRGFLHFTGATAAAAWAASRSASGPHATLEPLASAAGAPKKAVLVSMLPKELSILDRFKLAKEIGFAGTEVHTVTDPAQAEEMRAASEATGLRDPFRDERGALEVPALERRPRRGAQERRRDGDIAEERRAVQGRHRAARARGGGRARPRTPTRGSGRSR